MARKRLTAAQNRAIHAKKGKHVKIEDVPKSTLKGGVRYGLGVAWTDEKSANANADDIRKGGRKAFVKKIEPSEKARIYTNPRYATYRR